MHFLYLEDKTNLRWKKKEKRKKKGMGFGFFTQPSKFFHTLHLQYKYVYLSRFWENKTRLSYMSLAINIAR